MADLPEKPINRKEKYLNAIATGDSSDLPSPITREEAYLAFIAENGGGGGGGGGDVILYDGTGQNTDGAMTQKATTEELDSLTTMVADKEPSHTASAPHGEGSYLTLNGSLYKATQNISIGDSIEEGVNVSSTSVGNEMERFAGITYSAETETIYIPASIGTYADEMIILSI